MYVIMNRINPSLFWSNEAGWVGIDSADLFSRDEQARLNLPLDGSWSPLWSVDYMQFARFIAECEMCGVFSDEERLYLVADSMDCELDQVISLIDRATNAWDLLKARVVNKGKESD